MHRSAAGTGDEGGDDVGGVLLEGPSRPVVPTVTSAAPSEPRPHRQRLGPRPNRSQHLAKPAAAPRMEAAPNRAQITRARTETPISCSARGRHFEERLLSPGGHCAWCSPVATVRSQRLATTCRIRAEWRRAYRQGGGADMRSSHWSGIESPQSPSSPSASAALTRRRGQRFVPGESQGATSRTTCVMSTRLKALELSGVGPAAISSPRRSSTAGSRGVATESSRSNTPLSPLRGT